ncbi:alpha-tocopherol transfer protein [Leptinotarsa decemlineata]|uniref:alpha-tocopherol transfer protein n=1 Tax=Leptinotarsa decemlineata TaxID=7539 RepID=UPI003D308D0D
MEGDADIVILREWLMKQTHLPQKIEDKLLQRYLQASNNSIELAKNLIDLSFTLRSQAPEIFAERDPTQSSLQSTFEIIDYLLLPQRLNNINIFLYRITSNDVDKYDFINGCKAFFIFSDTRMIEEEDISDGEIPLFDMKNFSVKHLTKIVLPVLRKYMVYTQEAHPMNLKQIHLLNVPPFLDRMMMLLKPLMNSEVSKMLHFHSPNSETLFDYIPRDFLPEEYGGTKGKCADIKKYWSEKIIKRRDYLIDDARWIVDESKRPAENKGKQMYSVQGSFKTLSID